jgi:hypothetical protein
VFGIRPGIRQFAAAHKSEAPSSELVPVGDSPLLTAPAAGQVNSGPARTQEVLERVTAQMKKEPTQSSRLLQSWIHSE